LPLKPHVATLHAISIGTMNTQTYSLYKHSGKFGIHGPLLAVLAALVLGYPLGILYAYLIKWIPFIYLNFIITVGYGLIFGLLVSWLMKFAKVRNVAIGGLSGLAAGCIAMYLAWNGYLHTFIKDSPFVFSPKAILSAIKYLYENGSWGIGFSGSEPVTGIFLAIVWLMEAVVIIGAVALLGLASVSDTPFCEEHGCWLDEEKKIDKLDVFSSPDHIAAFQAGDISPLEAARPRIPAGGAFSRLTLRHSVRCDEFCTLSVANVTVTLDKEGKPQEKVENIVTNLQVPKTMFDYLAGFEHATARVPSNF